MCRLLYTKSEIPFAIESQLQKFAQIAKDSKEYQGHGWGCAYLQDEIWHHYKNINPIWEDDLDQFGETNLLLAHARSAFRDRDISIENNMPFHDKKHVFIFNGELHGVSLRINGRTGAEKLFNFIKRFDKGDMKSAIEKGVSIIERRSNYIKAMNFIIADKNKAYVYCHFNENKDYFTPYMKKFENDIIICSDRYDEDISWRALENKSLKEYE